VYKRDRRTSHGSCRRKAIVVEVVRVLRCKGARGRSEMEEKDRSTSPIREEIQIISEDDRIRIPMDSAAKFVKRTYFGLFSIYASRDGANKNGEDEDGSKSKDEETSEDPFSGSNGGSRE